MQNAARRVGAPAPKSPKSATAAPKRASVQPATAAQKELGPDEYIAGVPWTGAPGLTETVDQIMARERSTPKIAQGQAQVTKPELDLKEFLNRRENPLAAAVSQWPPADSASLVTEPSNPQTVGTSFLGPRLSESGFLPPDSVGAVGPTQVLVAANGRIKVFDKTGVLGALNVTTDVFFATVRSASTSDPHIRYDRLSGRWFVTIIDVATPNRVLIAVSSGSTITGTGSFTFFQFQHDLVGTTPNSDTGGFADYDTLGVDKNALYMGVNVFNAAGNALLGTTGFVINKANLLAGTLTVTAFRQLTTGSNTGPLTPQGVDNDDPAATEGYFIGVDALVFSKLIVRRITTPGGTPAISGNIVVGGTIPTTVFPILQVVKGSAFNRRLDGLDDRLFAAHIKKNKITGVSTLWTAHNIEVNTSGVGTSGGGRNGSRWYEIGSMTTSPTLIQSGTLFDSAAANPRGFWIPSVAANGQGHMALGCSFAGTNDNAGIAVAGRLRTDTAGTIQAATLAQTSSTAYNVQTVDGQRWGDYSQVTVDPNDDQTMWTFQEYCDAANSWGVRAIQLKAPPPVTPTLANPAAIQKDNPSTDIVITGVSVSGSEFFDPGPDTGGPGFANRIAVSISGGVIVNSVTFNSTTQITVNVSTVGTAAGSKNVTVTNPDGQSVTASSLILVGPTAAKVNDFTATGFNDGRVLLQWKSSHEIDNLGYNVYREVGNQRTRITPQIIAGSALVTGPNVALTAGKSYAWADQPQSSSARYWLEDVDLKGKSTWTGPVIARPSNARSPASVEQSVLLNKIGLLQGQMSLGIGSTPLQSKAEIAPLAADAAQIQEGIAGGSAVKLSVQQEGWYRISQRDLLAAGLDSRVNPRNLQLFVDGQQTPFIVTGEQDGRLDAADTVEFYGVGLNSAVTDTHVYWLVAGSQPGQRIKAAKTGAGAAAPTSFPYTVERKDRTLYFSALRNGEAENFFGPVIASSPVDQSLMLQNVSTSAPSVASLNVVVQGVTDVSHSVRVLLNGTQVGVINFSGQTRGKANIAIAQSQLREGSNSVELVAGGGADINLVDSVRITYWHKFVADSNVLRLSATSGQEISISGFSSSDIRVMDVTNPNAVQELTGTITGSKSNATISITPPGTGARLLFAFTGDRARSVSAKANIASDLHQEGFNADYIMITRAEMKASLEPLRALRQDQGHSVAVIDVEDIYDEFSFGNKSPQAIKDFLLFAAQHWRQAPRFLLMAGDSSYDSKNYFGFGDGDLVPTKLIDTFYMEAASDDWFTDFDGDGVPDMASGRLPVRNAQEAAALVAKIIGYENSVKSNSVLLVADANDGFNFAAVNPQLASLLPAGMAVEELTRGTADDATVKSRLLAAINSGQTIVNYNGHGSVDQWRADLLTNSDAAGLSNSQKLALFVMMTCMNGYYNDPALDSLAESLLRANAGAAAVWASTAQCEPIGQALVNQELYRQLFNGSSLTLGEVTARAKQIVNDPDIRRTWILFGDPAARLR